MSRLREALTLLTLLVVGCSTTPTHYYTLVPITGGTTTADTPLIELPSVRVPVQLDQRSFVVRLGANEVAPVESRRWLAPLPDEIAAALRADVQRRLGDTASTAGAAALHYRIVVDVSRFDGWLGQRLDLVADWTVIESRADGSGPRRRWNCSTAVTQSLAAGYPALVSGAQQSVDQLAAPIAALIQSAVTSNAPLSCSSVAGNG